MIDANLVLTILLFSTSFHSIFSETTISLPRPKSLQSMETPVRGVQAILLQETKLQFLGLNTPSYWESPYQEHATDREKKFGSLLAAKKFPLGKEGDLSTWVDMAQEESVKLLLDGQQLMMVSYDAQLQPLARGSLIWDLIQPARDPVGEATIWETQEVRKKLKTLIEKTPGKKLTGMVKLPKEWEKSEKTLWLVSSTLPHFPLFLMGCDPTEPTRCALDRVCPVALPDTTQIEIGGVGIDPQHHRVFLVDRTYHALRVIQYEACHALSLEATWTFPEAIQNVSNVKMAQNGSLWLTLADPDPYTNGSIVYYTPQEVPALTALSN